MCIRDRDTLEREGVVGHTTTGSSSKRTMLGGGGVCMRKFLLATVGGLIDLQDCLSVYFSPRDERGSAALGSCRGNDVSPCFKQSGAAIASRQATGNKLKSRNISPRE